MAGYPKGLTEPGLNILQHKEIGDLIAEALRGPLAEIEALKTKVQNLQERLGTDSESWRN